MSIAYRGRLVCIRCGTPREEAAAYTGCPNCAAEGVPVAVRPDYAIAPGPPPLTPSAPGIFRWGAALPLTADAPVTTLGEGRTPLLQLPRLGTGLGVGRLLLKDESRGPTWSWKDRLAATAVSKAAASGADTVIVSTTGNHGAAVAAYADGLAGIFRGFADLRALGVTTRLYAASLAGSNALGLRRPVTNAIVGVAGIAIGWWGVSQGIIESFLTFIGYLGYALPAIPAIIIADYFIVQRMRYPAGLHGVPAVNRRAVTAFALTVAVNVYLGVYLDDPIWHTLPLIGGVVYLLLSIPVALRNRRPPDDLAAARPSG